MVRSVDDYISDFPDKIREILGAFRREILTAAPDAFEHFSYGMPAYKLCGKPLVYFAAYRRHIGFYALPSGHSAFRDELLAYKKGKGSVQFPIDEPMPFELIRRMVQFRKAENEAECGNNAKNVENI